jgi:branched-subunit amino acid transport protein AzlD
MPEALHLLTAVAVSAAVTWALRALPFAALTALRASSTVGYLGARMPAGVMVILFVYCLGDLPVTDPARLLAPLLALTVTIGLHLWRRNALLSILAGTIVHVVLASAVLPR